MAVSGESVERTNILQIFPAEHTPGLTHSRLKLRQSVLVGPWDGRPTSGCLPLLDLRMEELFAFGFSIPDGSFVTGLTVVTIVAD